MPDEGTLTSPRSDSDVRQKARRRSGLVSSTSSSRRQSRRYSVESSSGHAAKLLPNGLHGRRHQEPAWAVWNDCIVLVGGLNLSRAEGAKVMQDPADPWAQEVCQGSHQSTVFNMSDQSVRNGPDVPIRNNHGMGAMSSDGHMHVLVLESYLLAAENEKAWLRHFVWDFAGGGSAWEVRAQLHGPRGAGRCEFVRELMYCFGGSTKATSGTIADLHIYNPATDKWTAGAPLPAPMDHLGSAVFANKIWITSGRFYMDSPLPDKPPKAVSSSSSYVYDPSANLWTSIEPLPYRRSSAALTVIKRTGKRPTLMAVGGQENFGIYSGTIFSMIEEYDFEENDWYCHDTHLPQGVFGAAIGEWHGKVYIVGGADGFYISAVDRVIVLDIEALSGGMPCLYKDRAQKDWWLQYNTGAMARFPYRKHFLRDD
ncbi:g12873 [Coccomyxa viridis]|uniref:G12873 protein n=1 Tax=Coccomyxa viridis TaxID=1274662 RepID=A0ABP1GE24_9CHLO